MIAVAQNLCEIKRAVKRCLMYSYSKWVSSILFAYFFTIAQRTLPGTRLARPYYQDKISSDGLRITAMGQCRLHTEAHQPSLQAALRRRIQESRRCNKAQLPSQGEEDKNG